MLVAKSRRRWNGDVGGALVTTSAQWHTGRGIADDAATAAAPSVILNGRKSPIVNNRTASTRRGSRPRVNRATVPWLCLRPPEQLEQDEHNAVDESRLPDERLDAGYALLQELRRHIVRRTVRDPDHWLNEGGQSDSRQFVSLAY